MKTTISVIFAVSFSAFLPACNRSESSRASASTASAQPTATPAAASAAPVAASPSESCPVGRWEYDYADQFLESITRNTPGARVVRESGKVICTISGRERGSYSCQVSEGGVENVFEAKAGSTPMVITAKLSGHSKVEYESAGPNRWRTTQADMSTLKIQVDASVGGHAMPMPALNMFPGMDRAGTVLEYRCEGDTLKLKPEVSGMTTDWANLKRAR